MSHRREPTAAQSRRPLPVLLALSLLAGVMSLVPATPAAALDPDLARGGISKNLEYPQDWSSFHGNRFWWYASQDSNPASPTAGADIRVEVKDRGPDAEHSELWVASFKDNWGSSTSRWKLVELPFSAFTLRTHHQAGAGETLNGTLDLDRAWGFAITFPPGTATPVGWAIDHVELYGTPSIEAAITVEATLRSCWWTAARLRRWGSGSSPPSSAGSQSAQSPWTPLVEGGRG